MRVCLLLIFVLNLVGCSGNSVTWKIAESSSGRVIYESTSHHAASAACVEGALHFLIEPWHSAPKIYEPFPASYRFNRFAGMLVATGGQSELHLRAARSVKPLRVVSHCHSVGDGSLAFSVLATDGNADYWIDARTVPADNAKELIARIRRTVEWESASAQ